MDCVKELWWQATRKDTVIDSGYTYMFNRETEDVGNLGIETAAVLGYFYGKTHRSMSILVPLVLWAPTLGIKPLRMSQKTCASSGLCRKGNLANEEGSGQGPSAPVTGTPLSFSVEIALAMRSSRIC